MVRRWKNFSLPQTTNPQDNTIYSNVQTKSEIPLEHLLVPRDHFSKSVMVSSTVSMPGKHKIYFVDCGVKIHSEIYQRYILEGVLREKVSYCYKFQQDGAYHHDHTCGLQIAQSWSQLTITFGEFQRENFMRIVGSIRLINSKRE